jgi:Sulfotransferase family
VFICGLARSGSTMLLEWLHAMPGFTAHRYADFPMLWTPYWWNTLLARLPRSHALPVERAHRDRIMVTRDSPEAFEEVLWSHFFPFDVAAVSDVLDARVNAPAFARLHREHIAKLVHARGARRYVAKGNYNVLRIAWLAGQYPDAHFIVPIREPLAHVASLLRQDALYDQAPAATLRHIAARGHHEFGALKRVVRVDPVSAAAIARDHGEGRAAQGWLRQWLAIYGHVLELLNADADFPARITFVPFEPLCEAPFEQLTSIARRIGIAEDAGSDAMLRQWSARFSAPTRAEAEVSSHIDSTLVERACALYSVCCSRADPPVSSVL